MKRIVYILSLLLTLASASAQNNVTADYVRALKGLRPALDTTTSPYYYGEIRSRLQDSSMYMGIASSGKKWVKIGETSASSGTVTSITTGYGLSGGTITTAGSIAADTAYLTSFLRTKKVVDSLSAVIATKGTGTVTSVIAGYGMDFTDITTAGFVNVDTSHMATRLRVKKQIDSLAAIIATKGSGTVTTVAAGYGMDFSDITTAGFVSVDTAHMATRLRVKKQVDSLAAIIATKGSGTVTTVAAGYGMNFSDITTVGFVSADTAFLASVLKLYKVSDSLRASLTGYGRDPMFLINQALGSSTKYGVLGRSISEITATTALADGTARFMAVYIPEATTITGVQWRQAVQGDYTGDNYNGVGLYSYSAGTVTLVASSTNDANIWKATANTIATKAFSSPYAASPGLYFIAALYNSSAAPTAPTLGGFVTAQTNSVSSHDYTNSGKYSGTLAAQTSLPASQAMSGVTATSTTIWLGLY